MIKHAPQAMRRCVRRQHASSVLPIAGTPSTCTVISADVPWYQEEPKNYRKTMLLRRYGRRSQIPRFWKPNDETYPSQTKTNIRITHTAVFFVLFCRHVPGHSTLICMVSLVRYLCAVFVSMLSRCRLVASRDMTFIVHAARCFFCLLRCPSR